MWFSLARRTVRAGLSGNSGCSVGGASSPSLVASIGSFFVFYGLFSIQLSIDPVFAGGLFALFYGLCAGLPRVFLFGPVLPSWSKAVCATVMSKCGLYG